MRIKKSYERNCDQMKKEFEDIKSEMELTWIEQKNENEKYIQGLKTDFERRLIHEKNKNRDLETENELLKQKMHRIKDVFVDVQQKSLTVSPKPSPRPNVRDMSRERDNRSVNNNYQMATSVREGPSNRSVSAKRQTTSANGRHGLSTDG